MTSQHFSEAVRPDHLVEVVRAILVDHLTTIRDGWSVRADAREWNSDTSLDSIGSGVDSLALLTLADSVNRRFLLHEVGIEDYLLARRRIGDWAELILEGWRRAAQPRLEFETSGSTSEPKRVTHSLLALEEEMRAFLEILDPVQRVVAYVPPHHIYGFLFTIVLPAIAGIPVERRYLNPIDMTTEPGDLVVSFPDHWRLIANRAADPSWRPADQGVSSTAPLPSETAQMLRGAGVRLIEVYGSTETAGVGYRSETDAPYTLLPYWSRAGHDHDQSHDLVRTSTAARGAGDGAADTDRAPVVDRASVMDRLDWLDDRHFRVLGRRDDVVQIGGVNVSPAAIAARLREHPSIAEVTVRAFAAGGSTRVKAFVVPEDPGVAESVLTRRIDEWAAERLRAVERPVSYTFGPRLPVTEMGKAADWAVVTATEHRDDDRS